MRFLHRFRGRVGRVNAQIRLLVHDFGPPHDTGTAYNPTGSRIAAGPNRLYLSSGDFR
jgi:hypothetical protein